MSRRDTTNGWNLKGHSRSEVPMNIESLRYFKAIAESQSLSQAAKRIHLSQQGLGKALRSLEAELRVPLVNVSPQGITLTEYGEITAGYAKKACKEFDAFRERLQELQRDRNALCAHGIKMNVSLIGILTVVKRMQKLGYLDGLVLRQAETCEALRLSQDPAWLSLVDIPSGTVLEEGLSDSFDTVALFESKMGLLARKDFVPLANRKTRFSPSDAAGIPLGVPDTATTRMIYKALFPTDVLNGTLLFTSSESELMRGMDEGRFAALTISCQWEGFRESISNPEDYAFHEIATDLTIRFVLAHSKSAPLSHLQSNFVSSFVNTFVADGFVALSKDSEYASNRNTHAIERIGECSAV